jgi:acetoacetate decarboxylase
MKLADVAKRAFAMPLTGPAYPRGPYKFYNREFVVISYRSDPDVFTRGGPGTPRGGGGGRHRQLRVHPDA